MMHPKYEYLTVIFSYRDYDNRWIWKTSDTSGQSNNRDEALNKFGSSGWVVRDVIQKVSDKNVFTYTFIRKIL